MKKEILVGILILFALLVITGVFFGENSTNLGNNTVTEPPKKEVIVDLDLQKLPLQPDNSKIANGGIIFSVNGEGDKEVLINFTSLAIHSPVIDMWVVLVNLTRELEFNETPMYAGFADIDAMEYNGIYLYFPSATVIENGVEHNALMFKDRMYLSGSFIKVIPNETSYVQITILKNESFLKTTDGEYVFVPKLRIRDLANSTLTVKADGAVVLNNGTLWTENTIGTNKNGELGMGLGIKSGDELKIGNKTIRLA